MHSGFPVRFAVTERKRKKKRRKIKKIPINDYHRVRESTVFVCVLLLCPFFFMRDSGDSVFATRQKPNTFEANRREALTNGRVNEGAVRYIFREHPISHGMDDE